MAGFFEFLPLGTQRDHAVAEEEARAGVHDAGLGAVLPHQLVRLAEALRSRFVVLGLVAQHAEGVDGVVGAAFALLALVAQDLLRLLATLPVRDRKQIQRAANAERRECEISDQHAAVGVFGRQSLERPAITRGGVVPTLAQLVYAAHLAIDLRAGARFEMGCLGERGGAIQACECFVLVPLSPFVAIGTTQRLFEEELGVPPTAFVIDGREVPSVVVEHALIFAVAQQHAAHRAQGDAALGMVEHRVELLVVHDRAHAVPIAPPRGSVERTEVTPTLAFALGRRQLVSGILEQFGGGADVEMTLGPIRAEGQQVFHRANRAGDFVLPTLRCVEQSAIHDPVDFGLPRHGPKLRSVRGRRCDPVRG